MLEFGTAALGPPDTASSSSTVNGLRMRGVCVQSMHQRRPGQNDPNPRVATTVDSPLVALRQAKPTLQIEIILDLFVLVLTDEKTGKEADHHRGHMMADQFLGLLELINQLQNCPANGFGYLTQHIIELGYRNKWRARYLLGSSESTPGD